MEHIPRPKRAENDGSEVVPYTAVLYDGGPFMTYPLRVGRPHVLPSYAENNNLIPYWRHEKLHPTPTPELESFIQTWLFFGLLHELLGELCLPSDFIRSLNNSHELAIAMPSNDRQGATQFRSNTSDGVLDDPSAKKNYAITTAKLPALLKLWVQKVQLEAIVASYDHIAQCLDLAYQTLSVVGPTFNMILKISIASAAEAIAFATNKAFDVTDYNKNNKCPVKWRQILDITPWKPALVANGWCPSQVFQLLQSSLFLHSMWHFLHVELQDPTKCHDKCTEKGCTAYQNQLDCYQTQHVDDHCSCQELTVDGHLTDSILQNDALPALRIIDNDELSDIEVKVLSTETSSRYLAISHVWADGMGNPHKNALPRCQLRRLKEVCQQLRREAFGENDDQELLIWIDTICCPVGPKAAKDRALANMKKTYENAACVLVLDSLIQRHNAEDLGVEEMSTAIFASGQASIHANSPVRWLRRLWTLQEGAIPAGKGRLWFHFRDKDINLRTIWRQMLDMSQDITMQPLASEIIMRIRSFTTLLHRSIQAGDDGADLKLVHDALQNRSVSVSSDEPLLIANLLGLDLEKLLAGPEGTRINRLWNLMTTAPKGIPKSVLFHVGPKLKDKGYKWAPSTMLSSDQLHHIIQGTEDVKSQGTPSSRGLLVNLPGFKLCWPLRPLGLIDNPWSLISKDGLLYMRDAPGNWCFLKRRVSVTSSASGDSLSTDPLEGIVRTSNNFYVVYPEKSFLMPAVQTTLRQVRSGLIVRTTGAQEREVNYVESYMHVNITYMDSAMQTMLNAAYCSVRMLSESEPVQALATFEGNVDLQDAQYGAVYDQVKPEIQRIARLPVNARGLAVAKATFGENGAKLLGAFIGLFFIGHYAVIEGVTEELQQWCID